MSGQRFYASADTFTWPNGAIGHRPGGPFDCLGPYAKVRNCPVEGTDIRRTVYATGYADTWFSVPAVTHYKGQSLRGYLTMGDSGIEFRPYTARLVAIDARDYWRAVKRARARHGVPLAVCHEVQS